MKDSYKLFNNQLYKSCGQNESTVEFFGSDDNTLNITNDTTVNKELESTLNINRSMVVNATNKIVNKAINDVTQNNTAQVSGSVGATNTIAFRAFTCDVINLSNIDQNATALQSIAADVEQSTENVIKTSMTTEMSSTIKNGLPDAGDIQKQNNKALKEFMDSMPGYDADKAKEMVEAVSDDTFDGDGNDTQINNKTTINAKLKQELNLDESFTINQNDEIGNDIKNIVKQTNFASCEANAGANNWISFDDVKCKSITLDNIQQKAFVKQLMSCVFTQENKNTIVNKVINKVENNFQRMYAAAATPIAKNSVAKLGAAMFEGMINAANKMEPEEEEPKKKRKKRSRKPRTPPDPGDGPPPEEKKPEKKSNFMPLIIGGAVAISIIIIIIVIIMKKKNNNLNNLNNFNNFNNY